MKFPVHRLELAAIHLCVDLGGGDGGMAEHFLDDPEIGSSRQQVGGEGVAELVWMDRVFNARMFRVVPDKLPDAGRGQWMTTHRKEDRRTRSGQRQVLDGLR